MQGLGIIAVLAGSVGVAALGGGGACGGNCEGLVGPPMVCVPIDVAGAPTISGPNEQGTQPVQVQTVLAALNTAPNVLVRIETLRLATLDFQNDKGKARDLLLRLAVRAMDAEAANAKRQAGLAYCDAACFVACLDQIGSDVGDRCGAADGVDGYLWMQHALTLSGGDGEMEFAAALVVHPAMHTTMDQAYLKHLNEARRKAAKGSLLEKNLDSHIAYWGKFLDVLKTK